MLVLLSRSRRLVALALLGLSVPAAVAGVTAYRGARVADELCLWLNTKARARPDLRVGSQTEAVLAGLRDKGDPIECTTGSSPYADSLFTETAILLRSSRGAAVGLRVAPLSGAPAVLGYWTP